MTNLLKYISVSSLALVAFAILVSCASSGSMDCKTENLFLKPKPDIVYESSGSIARYTTYEQYLVSVQFNNHDEHVWYYLQLRIAIDQTSKTAYSLSDEEISELRKIKMKMPN